MRLLQINNYHYPRGGSDRYFLNVARGLTDRGHEVRTLAPVDPRDIDTDMRARFALEPMALSPRPRPVDIPRFFYNGAARRVVRQVIGEFRPEIVHLHIYYGQLTSSVLGPIRAAGIPIVQTLHEYKIVCPAQTMLREQKVCTACRDGRYWHAAFYRCNRGSLPRSAISAAELVVSEWFGARRHIDRFLAVSDFQRTQLLSMGLEAEKIIRLYNFTQVAETASTSPGDYFLYSGRVTYGKGLETLIRAYKLYRDQCEAIPLPLHIVGTGDAVFELQDLAEHIGVADGVRWLGYKTGEALDHVYRNCRALINPSDFNETFGLNNLEAMAHGRPVICSDRGAFPEIVRDETDGFVVNAGDVIGFADKMRVLSPERALEMGWQGYQRAKHIFSEDTHLSELERIYATVA